MPGYSIAGAAITPATPSHLARRNHRHGQARLADGADAAWPDRHDDERPRAARPAWRPCRRRGGARANRAVRRLRLGMGLVSAVAPLAAQAFGARQPRIVRRALRVGLWAAPCSACRSRSCSCTARKCCSRSARRRIRPQLAARYLYGLAWCLVPGWWFIALRGFMGAVNRPEPALWITLAAIPANLVLAYAPDLRRLRLAAPRPARRRPCDHDRQSRHVRRGRLGLLCAAVHSGNIACSARFWRLDWPLMRELFVGRHADLRLLPAGIRRVRRRRPADGPDRHGGARRASDRAADRRHHVHGAVRHLDGGDRAGRPRGRPRDSAATRRAGFAAIALGAVFMATMTVLGRDSASLISGGVPRRIRPMPAPRLRRLPRLCCSSAMSFFIADGIQTVAAGALRGLNDTRMPMLFRRALFLGGRLYRLLSARLPARLGRLRRLDRAFAVGDALCGLAGLALSTC